MTTDYKHIRFVIKDSDLKDQTKFTFSCINNRGEEIGVVAWYEAWEEFCYFSSPKELVYNAETSRNISDFLGLRNDALVKYKSKIL